MKGKTNEDDAVQVRREGRQGKNSGNKAELINQIQHRFGGKSCWRGAQENRKEDRTLEKGKQQHKTRKHTHTMKN